MPEQWRNLYEELKGWQAGIGSVVGFLALLGGAWWNFRLNRRRDAALRREEALSIATALYGEILLLRSEAARLARHLAPDPYGRGAIDRHFLQRHQLSEPTMYPALAGKIGLLEPKLVIAITTFHKNFREAKQNLQLLMPDEARSFGYTLSWVLEPAVAAVNEVRPFLRNVEKMARLPAAEDPELGYAETILDHDREIADEPVER